MFCPVGIWLYQVIPISLYVVVYFFYVYFFLCSGILILYPYVCMCMFCPVGTWLYQVILFLFVMLVYCYMMFFYILLCSGIFFLCIFFFMYIFFYVYFFVCSGILLFDVIPYPFMESMTDIV